MSAPSSPSSRASVPSRGSIVASLRASTAALHQQLDGSMRLHEALSTRDGYAAFLRASYAAVEPMERALEPFTAIQSAQRAARIVDDLAALDRLELEPLETESRVPEIHSEAAAFGCAYVLEGSSMGGVMLARRVDEALSLKGRAVSYLRLRGAHTAPAWKAFLEALHAWGERHQLDEHARACDAAAATFRTYLSAFGRAGLTALDGA